MFWYGLGAVLALTAAHAYALRLPWDLASPLVLANHLFAIGLLLGLLWLSGAIGLRMLRTLGVGRELSLQNLLFALGLGLGTVAYMLLACGLLGWLKPWVLTSALAVLATFVRRELSELTKVLPSLKDAWLSQRRELRREPLLRLTLLLTELLILPLLLRALTPPTGYDAVLYHLAGPKEFLRLERVAPLPDLSQVNMPFTVNMLYVLGLAFGSDELPGLLHLTFAVLTALATFALGRRFFNARLGLLAAAIFLSPTAVLLYAPAANIDFGWTYFEILAVFGFAIWCRERKARWLFVAGLAAGLSLGSKYLAALTCAAIGLGILFEFASGPHRRPLDLVRLLALFAIPAALVGAPWYIKNWLWFGNPVWPLLANYSPLRDGLDVASGTSHGRGLLDIVLQPLELYHRGDPDAPIARPPMLLLLVPLYALARKDRLSTFLLGLSALQLLVWSQNIQSIRYLFPTFAFLGLVTANLLDQGMRSPRVRNVGRVIAPTLVLVSVLLGAGSSLFFLVRQGPVPQLLGLESRQAFLNRVMPDYAAVDYLNVHRAEVSRVLIIGDPRLFYLEVPAIVDQGMAFTRALVASDPEAARAQLQRAGFSHVLISESQLVWNDALDPDQRLRRWWESFERTRSAYLITEYSSDVASVYRVADHVGQRSEQ